MAEDDDIKQQGTDESDLLAAIDPTAGLADDIKQQATDELDLLAAIDPTAGLADDNTESAGLTSDGSATAADAASGNDAPEAVVAEEVPEADAAVAEDLITETSESAEGADTAEDGSEEAEGEEGAEADLPPAGPRPPEEPKNNCPACKGGGAPAWMATFADMATLLMAFFVLLLSFAETEVPKFKQVAGSLKQAFGIEKIVPKVTIPMARSIMVENFTPAVAERSVLDVKTQRSDFVRGDFIEKKTEEGEYDENLETEFLQVQEALEAEMNKGMADVKIEDGEIKVTLVEPNAAGGGQGAEGEGSGGAVPQEVLDAVAKVAEVSANFSSDVGIQMADKARGKQQGANASERRGRGGAGSGNSKYEQLRADLSEEIAAGLAEVERDGDKIIVRLASQGSFTSGSAELRQTFTPTLARLGNSLAKYSGSVMVEGHTDNVPVAFSERFKSNWDLSAARAASIADFLLNSTSLEGGNVQIAGFADTRPLDSNDSSAGRARNRRIEVIVDDN
jgi:chemotaxis protein MotB